MDTLYSKELRETDKSWVSRVTPDQEELNSWLEKKIDEDVKILHIGTGNSSLAKLICKKSSLITGITIIKSEYELAKKLELDNYEVFILDKYSSYSKQITSNYSYIVDNNLTSYAKSLEHLTLFLENCFNLLDSNGIILSHMSGLHYRYEGSDCGVYSLESLENLLKDFDAVLEKERDILKIKKKK